MPISDISILSIKYILVIIQYYYVSVSGSTLDSDVTFYVTSSSILSSMPDIPLPASHISQNDLRGLTSYIMHHTWHCHTTCSPQPPISTTVMTRMRGVIRPRLSIYSRRLLRAYKSLAIAPIPLPSSCVLCCKVVDASFGESLRSMTNDRISITDQRGNKNIWLYFPQTHM